MQKTSVDFWVGKICWRRDRLPTPVFLGFLCGSAGKESTYNAGDLGSILGLGRSPGEGKGYPLQYSSLENSMDCIVHGVAELDTTEWLSLHRLQIQGFSVLHCLPEFAQVHVLWVSDILSNNPILCHLLLLLPSIFLSTQIFSNELAVHLRWPKYWSFSFSINPSNEYSGLISLRINWFDFLAIQGTLKNLLQHHRSKASIFQCSAFFKVQLYIAVHDNWKSHNFD